MREKVESQSQLEQKLRERETKLDEKLEEIDQRLSQMQEDRMKLQEREQSIEHEKIHLASRLEKIAHLSSEEAKTILFQEIEDKYEQDIIKLLEKKQKDLQAREKEMSKEILIKSLQNYAGDLTAEVTQTIVNLENDDIKGKLIGKEGRNIIAFERATGVSLIIDDTPDTVFLSSFDLFRRYIAKRSLDELIADKRIQPARIEEIVEKNQQEAENLIAEL